MKLLGEKLYWIRYASRESWNIGKNSCSVAQGEKGRRTIVRKVGISKLQ